MTKYTWTDAGWVNNSTGAVGGTPNPGTGTVLMFPAGVTANAVLSPGNMASGGPVVPYGSIVVGAGAAVDLGTFSSFDTSSYNHFAVGNLYVGAQASLSLLGSIEGSRRPRTCRPATSISAQAPR